MILPAGSRPLEQISQYATLRLERGINIMADFGNSFSGLAKDRMLTPAELIRAIRFMVAAEYEAIQLYTQLAESTDNKLAQAVLLDIANEEKVHAGEFLRLLQELAPDEESFYSQGAAEVKEIIPEIV
jgi:rubrerythrin